MPAAIYARQSIEKADSVSIDAQIERCRAVCGLNGWDFTVYSDVGFSGKNLNRPNFERLLADIRAGRIDALVSYKLDRISRSITDFSELLQLFEKYGVQYISATEQFDTSSPVGRAMIYIVMVFAQLERETTTQRVTDNYRYRASQGLYMGGNAPLGFAASRIILDGRKASVLRVDEDGAAVVRSIYSRYQSGRNTHRIALSLNEEGILTSQGKIFSANAVLRILRNLTYCADSPELYEYLKSRGYPVLDPIEAFDGAHGMCCYFKSGNGKPVPAESRLVAVGRHGPVVPAKQWIAVQSRLDSAQKAPKPRSSASSLLAGLLKCADCGASFGLKTTRKKSGSYSYYFCRGRAGQGKCKNDLWIAADLIEPALARLLCLRAKKVLQGGRESPPSPAVDPRAAVLERERVECSAKIEKLLEGVGLGNSVVDGHLTSLITRLDARKEELEAQLERLDRKEKPAAGAFTQRIDLPALFAAADTADKSAAARTLIKKIEIGRDGKVKVEWLI